MIEYDPKNWTIFLRYIFPSSGSVLFMVWPQVLLTIVTSIIVIILNEHEFKPSDSRKGIVIAPNAHRLLGSTLAFLIVLRSRLALNRYGEARSKLGAMGKAVRNLSREISDYESSVLAIELSRYLQLFMALTRLHLRDENGLFSDPKYVNPELYTEDEKDILEPSARRPLKILGWLEAGVDSMAQVGIISQFREFRFVEHIESLGLAFQGSNKIRALQLPLPYAQLLTYFLGLYVYTLPFVLVATMGRATPLVSALFAVILFGINSVAKQLADPYGYDANDLPIDELENAVCEDVQYDLHRNGHVSGEGHIRLNLSSEFESRSLDLIDSSDYIAG